jgi:hypothetical protein
MEELPQISRRQIGDIREFYTEYPCILREFYVEDS